MELKARTAVITGASGQLGGNIAIALAKAGCRCVCHYHSGRDKAEEVVEKIQALGEQAIAVRADLCDSGQIENLFEQAVQLGQPTILINSAAVFSRQPLSQVTSEKTRSIFELNLTAPILLCKAFTKRISEKSGDSETPVAKIINISDVAGVSGWPEYVVYCSSKAGLNAATKAMAKELAPAICVNSVAVGIVNWQPDLDQRQKQRQLDFIPLKRIAKINEITEPVIFLLKNDYITGQILNVDGGRVI